MKPARKEEFITDSKGKRKAVILDKHLYQEVRDDQEDLRLLAERTDEATSSLEEVEERLKAANIDSLFEQRPLVHEEL